MAKKNFQEKLTLEKLTLEKLTRLIKQRDKLVKLRHDYGNFRHIALQRFMVFQKGEKAIIARIVGLELSLSFLSKQQNFFLNSRLDLLNNIFPLTTDSSFIFRNNKQLQKN